MSYDVRIASKLYDFGSPAIGILALVCVIGGLQVGMVDVVAFYLAVVLCVLSILTPVIRRLTALVDTYTAWLFTALHALDVYIGVSGMGLLSPAAYFTIVFPILSAVFLSRTIGLINVVIALTYIGLGLLKYFYFPSSLEAAITPGVAIVIAMVLFSALVLGFAISLLFVSESERFARERDAVNAELEEARAHVSQALNNMSNGLVMVGSDGTILLHNDRVPEMFKLAPSELRPGISLTTYLRNIGARVGWDAAQLKSVIDSHRSWLKKDVTTKVEHHFDSGMILATACRPMPDGGAVLTYDDVTELRQGQRQIAHMAFHDALTGLPNRRSFADHLSKESTQNEPYTLLLLDLDHFKRVNDTFGHAVGDQLLVEVAQRLRETCRPTDLLFRLGGDELAMVTRLELDNAQVLAGRIVAAISRPFALGPNGVSVGMSIGIARSTGGQDLDIDTTQRMADLALYEAKNKGRGRAEVYRDGMIEEAAERHKTETELGNAIATGALELHYQPLFDLPERTLVGFEALLRWRHPERGLLLPADFIPIAEQNGSILEIGAWVIHQACEQVAKWPAHVNVSINISPVQLRSIDTLRQFTNAFDRHGVTPNRVEVEVSETAMVEDNAQIAAVLAGLRALGVRIAMNDFGTGYSSLAHLREFELDRIKIDRSFIAASHHDAGSAAVVRAVTAMAKELTIATTGGGIEDEEQLSNLIALGCGTAQGYLLGEPLIAGDATALIAGQRHSPSVPAVNVAFN